MVYPEANLVIAIVIGSLIMFLLTLVIVVFVVTYSKRLKEKENNYLLSMKNKELELLRGIIDAQDAEREKIASSLHDEIGPLLTVLKLNLTKHTRSLDKQALAAEDLLQERKFIDTIIENVRSVSHELTPHFVKNNGLVYGLQQLVSSISSPTVKIHPQMDDKALLNNNLTVNCYRIVLELLNNIIKHDNAETVEIIMKEVNQQFEIWIEHDGTGLQQADYLKILATNQRGMGLHSVNSRLLVLNGEINYNQHPKPSIQLLFPLKND